jgi:hypothetical protein
MSGKHQLRYRPRRQPAHKAFSVVSRSMAL